MDWWHDLARRSCPHCAFEDDGFLAGSALDQHVRDEHTARCELCGFVSENEPVPRDALRAHQVAEHSLQCDACGHHVIDHQYRLVERLAEHRYDEHGITVDCRVCGERFRSQRDRDAHEGAHWHECEWCGRGYRGLEGVAQLERHMAAIHSAPCTEPGCGHVAMGRAGRHLDARDEHHRFDAHGITVDCRACQQQFRNSSLRDAHEQGAHVARCDFCADAVFRGRDFECLLAWHVREEHTVSCKECGCEIMGRQLVARVEQHRFDAHGITVDCRACRQQFRSTPLRDAHVRDTHSARCDFCADVFIGRDFERLLAEHVRERHTEECGECGREFVGRDAEAQLERHERDAHVARCDFCVRVFRGRDFERRLARHVREEHTADCGECGVEFVGRDAKVLLQRHERDAHSARCDFCVRVFRGRDFERLHAEHVRKQHTEECGECGQKFVGRDAKVLLQRHERDAHVARCDFCTVVFRGRDFERRLARHVREEHTEECDECGREFVGRDAETRLEQHEFDAHGISFDCEVCGRAFRHEADCDRHEASCEPPRRPVPTPGRWVPLDEFKGRKSFGYYRCDDCGKWWMSAHAFKDKGQACNQCNEWRLPVRMWQNAEPRRGERREVEDRGPHDQARCQACREGICLRGSISGRV